MSDKMPEEVQELLAMLADRPGKLTQSRLQGHMQRDFMKLGTLMQKMGLEKMPSMTEDQRNLIALGWLCGTFHENCFHVQTMGGNGQGNMLEAVMGTAMGGILELYYDVQEHVIVNFLDGDEFDYKAVKSTPYGKSMTTMRERQQRLYKIMRAKRKEEDDDEEELDMASVKRAAAKPKKRNLN